MRTKSMEERVSALESCAFQTGRDLAEIKSVQREHTNRLAAIDERLTSVDERLTGMDERMIAVDGRLTAMDKRLTAMDKRQAATDERMVRLEYGVGLLLDHYGIERAQP